MKMASLFAVLLFALFVQVGIATIGDRAGNGRAMASPGTEVGNGRR